MDFFMKIPPTKWKQGTFVVVFHDSVYIYRYTFSMFQYTFIGWVWECPAAHLHQVYVRDTPPATIYIFIDEVFSSSPTVEVGVVMFEGG